MVPRSGARRSLPELPLCPASAGGARPGNPTTCYAKRTVGGMPRATPIFKVDSDLATQVAALQVLVLDLAARLAQLEAIEDEEHEGAVEGSRPEDWWQPGFVKTIPEKKQVFGWAYVSKTADGQQVVDVSGDVIDDVEELEKAAAKFVTDYRAGRYNHSGETVATLIESTVFTPEKVEKLGIPQGILPTGWWVGFQVHDDGVWKQIADGRVRAFSVGGVGKRSPLLP